MLQCKAPPFFPLLYKWLSRHRDVRIARDSIPIDPVPPALRIRPLATTPPHAHAVVGEVDMLPRVDAQDGVDIDAAGRRGLPAQLPKGPDGVHHRAPGDPLLRLGVHVHRLLPVVRARVRRPRQVGREQRVLSGPGLVRLDQPHEAGAEHGARGDYHFLSQGVDGGEGALECDPEGVGHGGFGGGEASEEEVVVVRHRGVVEDWCRVRVAGVFYGDVFGEFGLVLSS